MNNVQQSAMNNVQQSTTVVSNTLETLRVFKKVLTARFSSKLLWIKRHFDRGIKTFILLQSTKK
jgi:hypothetical protein